MAGWLITYGWLVPTRASYLHSRRFFIWMFVVVCIVTLLAYFICPEPNSPIKRSPAGTVICLPLPSSWSSLTLTTMTSFMMALFTNNLLNRWWATRKHVSSTGGRCKNIAMLLTAWTARSQGPVADQRRRAVRFLNLAHALLFNTAEKKTSLEGIQPLVDKGLCDPEEAALLAGAPEPYVTVVGWVAAILDDLCSHYRALTPTQSQNLVDLLVDMRNNAGDALLFVGTQLPYAIVQTVAVIVYCFLAQMIAVCSGVVGKGLLDGDASQVSIGYITVVLCSFIFTSLLSLYATLSNPFGDDACDFPSLAYKDSLRKLTNSLEELIPEAATTGMLHLAPKSRAKQKQSLVPHAAALFNDISVTASGVSSPSFGS